MADTDGLTGAYNRRFFDEYFSIEYGRVLSQVRYKPENIVNVDFGIAILDIDNFKSINDTYGHGAGDMVLKQMVKLVKEMVFDRDVVCRYGGEEFAIIFTNTDFEGVKMAAEKIRAGIERADFYLGAGIGNKKITVSVGASMFSENHEKENYFINTINLADERLYEAKRSGKNKVVFN